MIINLATATGTQHLWKQERIIVKATGYQNTDRLLFYTNLHGSQASPIASYVPDGDGSVYVDITDYVRVNPSVTSLYFYDGNATYTIAVSVDGLINPAEVIIPPHNLDGAYALIVPPSLILYDGGQEDDISAEFYATTGTWSVTGLASLANTKRSIGQISGAFTLSNGTNTESYETTNILCDRDYVYVKWVSFTGVERKHIFYATKQTLDAAEKFSLLTIDNSYNEIKGRVDSMTLKLDNLDRYDLWYYCDILLSSHVEVSIDGGSTYTQVQVTGKGVTLPDGDAGNDGKLEVDINYKRYDAVAM